tara:strand:+ start:59431 stop:60519 length:1089 start_codon:yes stop_codon:yes gene_type:complete
MKRILLILVLFTTTIALSQEKTFESEVKRISNRIDRITKQQKDSLRVKVREINLQLENNDLTKTEANVLKKKAAAYHAKQIEKLVGEQQKRLQVLVQAKTDGKILGEDRYYEESTFSVGGTTFQLRFTEEDFDKKMERLDRRNRRRWRRRTTSQFVFAMGANNVLENNQLTSLNDSPYKFWKSRFYEVGFTFKYRLKEEASKTYLKYGVSFLWNNLRPDGNQYHVVNGQETNLEVYPLGTSESRLRHVQMIFPMHLEFDLSKNRKHDDGKVYDRRHQSWRLGFGGFVGFKLGTRQYLEYRNASGTKIEELQKGSFNTNIYNYGLSSYVSYKSLGLYVKYDLNPLFKNTQTRNLSMGVRFDLD